MQPIKDQTFKRNLALVVPSTEWLNMADAPISYLQELYPNIWLYGPRGDTYAAQIQTLLANFENYARDRNELAHFVNNELPKFNHELDISRYVNRQGIQQAAFIGQRPEYPFSFLNNKRQHPVFHNLRTHLAFMRLPTDNTPLVEQLLINFTYHSLYRDIIARHEGNANLMQAWENHSTAWHFKAQ